MNRTCPLHSHAAAGGSFSHGKRMKKNYCLTAAEMRSADLYTSEVIGIPSLVLMERAALAAADVICQDYSHARAAVIAGSGNNGADGIATGRILMDRGFTVDFFLLSEHVHEGSQLETQLHIIRQYGTGARLFSVSRRMSPIGYSSGRRLNR